MARRKLLYVGAPGMTAGLGEALRAAEWELHSAFDLRRANRLLAEHRFQVGLLLYAQVDESLCAELDCFLAAHESLEWVGCFDADSLLRPSCRDLILDHLFDHHTLPLDPARVLACVGHAHGRARLRQATGGVEEARPVEDAILGHSLAITQLLRQAQRVANAGAPVLIHGESGSGKELVAQSIHRQSPRSRGPFIAINCGAFQATLIQSELFGHERGAFTGAVAEKRGLFEAASGGTVFLDEIGDLPLELQTNLLRFLQEGTINRVGSARSIQLDVRVVAATNVDLEKAVASGAFRHDLYYRLNVLPLRVQPLREHREDIKLLACHFFRKFAADKNPRLKGFSRSAIGALEAHVWPGNVRELINRVRRAMIMAEGKLITPGDLELDAANNGLQLQNELGDARLKAERSAIFSSLRRTGGNVASAARQLGVSRMTLYRLMVRHGINGPQ